MSTKKIDEGKKGENFAESYLHKKGYRTLERNFKKRYEEIDTVALNKDVLIFEEVKTGNSSQFGAPLDAITPRKLKSVIKTAEYYTLTHKNLPESFRIDAVGIKLDDFGGVESIEHIENISGFKIVI